MKLTCIGGTGPQFVVVFAQNGELAQIHQAPHTVPDGALVGSFNCAGLYASEYENVPLPEPSGGLLAGVLLLAVLARRKR